MAFGKRNALQGQAMAPACASQEPADNVHRRQASERARYEKELQAQATLINSRLPAGCEVIPWALIPASVWAGANGQFLMNHCGFYPCHPLNNMLLAANEQTARMLDLPIHPRVEIPEIRENCDRLIGELLFENASPSEQARKVVTLAVYMGSFVWGQAAWDRHTFLFGIGLGMGQRQ